MSSSHQDKLLGRTKRLAEPLKQVHMGLIALIAVLSIVSLVSVNTASSSETYQVYFGGGMLPIFKQIILLTLGLVSLIVVAYVPRAFLKHPGTLFYFLFCVGLLLGLLALGRELNGATRWFQIPGIPLSIQPSEFVKLGFVLLLSLFASSAQDRGVEDGWDMWLYYGLPIGLVLGATFFLAKENISTGIILVAFVLCYMFIIRMPFAWWWRLAVILFSLGATAYLAVRYLPQDVLPGRLSTAKARLELKADVKPEEEFVLVDKRRQEQYGKIALANSRLFLGEGVGGSKMKDILPMANSDYIYAVLIEEMGAIALFGVPALYVAWFVIAGLIARREKNRFYKYVLYGIGLVYPLQALVNIVVVSGVLTTGQPLPFLSAGGSSLLSCCLAFGVMLSISRGQYERAVSIEAYDEQRTQSVETEIAQQS